MSKKFKDTEYLHLSAMLRAREARMLNREKAERMIDSSDFAEAAKIAEDAGYPDMSAMRPSEIEAALARRRFGALSELSGFEPARAIADVFRLQYDYHNAKALIKAEAMDTDPRSLFSYSGRVQPETLAEAYREESLSALPPRLAAALGEASGILARTSNPQLADFALDRAYFEELTRCAAEVGCPFLDSYVRIKKDAANLRSAVRTLRMRRDVDFLRLALISGGSVDAERVAAESGSAESVAALFSATPLGAAAALAPQAVNAGAMTRFELAVDNALNAFLGRAKLTSFGPEAVIAYIASLENEINSVRMILTGKLAGISRDTLRERLRDFYA